MSAELPRGASAKSRFAAALALAFLAATSAAAHELERKTEREIVRLQGYRGDAAPAGAQTVATIEIDAFGEKSRFAVTDWQAFDIEAKPAKQPPDPKVVLQGARADVHRVGAARPDQRISVLGERRRGTSDIFILAVDLCPPN